MAERDRKKIVLSAEKVYDARFGFVAEYMDVKAAEKDFGIEFSDVYSREKLDGIESVNGRAVTADGVKIEFLSNALRGSADKPAKYAMVIVKCFKA
ncbi:hypothetical protein [Ruminococcus sp. Marseille-P6503]|uniref:hypothetical protein n=1 Tax=Ruminococcus sp. Marseille-P6503 TaxID=2364796 RepID=UPI000F535EA4|nr:hypothetical protein [Ruminococcus sp. Marseille-P6503]